jgi:flagellar motor switch protein FliN/FliY
MSDPCATPCGVGDGVDAAVAATDPPAAGTAEPARGADGTVPIERLSAIDEIPVQLSVVLGRTTLAVSELLRLGRGAVIELDRKVGEPVEIHVNNRLVARGEVVVAEDRLAVTMTEIVGGGR